MARIAILDAGFVSAINMYAPVVNPIIVSGNTVGKILREGHRVVEYNKNDKSILLTLDNYNDPHRFDDPVEIAKQEAAIPVVNAEVPNTEIDTQAATFTGYTKNTIMDMEPAKAPASAEAETTTEPKLTKAQRKALAKAKREEEAAKAVEVTTEDTTVSE